MSEEAQVVWFKRDLRVADHAPLAGAAAAGPVVPLYIVEPAVWGAADFDRMHARFVIESLEELAASLQELGAPLVVRVGDAVAVLEALRRQVGFGVLWSHMESGNEVTFQRDRAVQRWARAQGVVWRQPRPFGVTRGRAERDGWQRRWEAFMAEPLVATPQRLRPALAAESIDWDGVWAVAPARDRVEAPVQRAVDLRGGSAAGAVLVDDFLGGRGRGYQRGMSSPVTAYRQCSRWSPYITWGCLSMKTLVQRVRQARAALKAGEASDTGVGVLAADLRALDARLHWHCHFIQKLEAEPAIEFRCFNRACEALRERGQGGELMAAWRAGMTGVPFVDACMRALQARGWINFRMRAMLVSFAAYDLWVDWRDFSHFLACQFIDYEPGIHYSQLQMQSGTTGINTLRMYNPWKQGVDQDPDGVFIRAWVPELADWTAAELHSPLAAGRRPAGYPAPVVDHAAAVKRVRAAFSALRRDPAHRAEAERVFREHGSRKRPRSRQGAARRDGGRAAAQSGSAARPAGSEAQQGLLGL